MTFEALNQGLFIGNAFTLEREETRANVEENLYIHLTASELAPLREGLVDMRDRKITLAKEILANVKQLERAELLRKLKMVGLVIGVVLVGAVILAALAGAVFCVVSLLKALPFLVVNSILRAVCAFFITLAEAALGYVVGFKGFEFLMWLFERGREEIEADSGIDELERSLDQKNDLWRLPYQEEEAFAEVLYNRLSQVKKITEVLPLLERLNEAELLDEAIYDCVQQKLGMLRVRGSFLPKEELLQHAKDWFYGDRNDGDLILRLPEIIKKYDQLQVQKAAVRTLLVKPENANMPKELANMVSAYMV